MRNWEKNSPASHLSLTKQPDDLQVHCATHTNSQHTSSKVPNTSSLHRSKNNPIIVFLLSFNLIFHSISLLFSFIPERMQFLSLFFSQISLQSQKKQKKKKKKKKKTKKNKTKQNKKTSFRQHSHFQTHQTHQNLNQSIKSSLISVLLVFL